MYKEPVQQPLTAAYQDILQKTSQVNIKYEGIRVIHDEEMLKKWLENDENNINNKSEKLGACVT